MAYAFRDQAGNTGGNGPAAPTPAPAPAPKKPAYTAPKAVSSSSGGTIVPVASAPAVTAPPPVPSAPSIDDWLAGDTTFNTQNDALSKAMADYLAQMGASTNQYNTDYNASVNKLKTNRTQGFNNLTDDYAARGMMNSGLYGQAYSDLEKQFNDQQTSLDTAKANWLANLESDRSNFASDQSLQLEKARQDAINRRAAQYGV